MQKSHILSAAQISGFLDLIGRTREHEYVCSECLEHVAEFAERELAGQPRDDAMRHVEHHLAVCPECREEYSALRTLLLYLSSETGGSDQKS